MTHQDAWRIFSAHPGAEMLADSSIQETFLDVGGLEAFWRKWYLEDFISSGYGKVKFLFGGMGAGKTHWLRRLAITSDQLGYLVAFIDARLVRLSDIEELYRAVVAAIPLAAVVDRACRKIIVDDLGYREFDGDVVEFSYWLEHDRELDPALFRRDIREAVDRWLHPQDLATDFLLAIRSWIHQRLMNETNQHVPEGWILGEKLMAPERKSLGVKSSINRRNARAVLSSLAVFSHAAGFPGILVAIDNFDSVAKTTRTEGEIYYTRGKRDQSYEMMRQLIDESVHTPFLMLVLGGDRQPLSDSRSGFPSYPALWARIENEISTDRVNRFADAIVLDDLWQEDMENVKRLASVWSLHHPEITPPATRAETETAVGLEWSLARRVVLAVMSDRNLDIGEGDLDE